MTEQALVRAEPEVTTMIQVIERAASNPSVDLDKMERLLEMQERILNRNAEAEFNEAMTRAQSEMGRISADANNPQTRSRYASYGQLDQRPRPAVGPVGRPERHAPAGGRLAVSRPPGQGRIRPRPRARHAAAVPAGEALQAGALGDGMAR